MKKAVFLGALVGAAAGAVQGLHHLPEQLAIDPTGTAPGHPFHGIDPRLPGMTLA